MRIVRLKNAPPYAPNKEKVYEKHHAPYSLHKNQFFTVFTLKGQNKYQKSKHTKNLSYDFLNPHFFTSFKYSHFPF